MTHTVDPEVVAVTPEPPVLPLSHRGRAIRLVVLALGFLLVTAGTVHGSDNDFPFGPLRKYATRDSPNGQITQAVVLARTSSGRTFDVTDTATAPRRAELEGRLSEFAADPSRFAEVAVHYIVSGGGARLRGHSGEVVTEIELVRRVYPLRGGQRGGPSVDQAIATWRPT